MSTYKLIEELGRGGMGVVYRALHPALGREVAIKFLQGAPDEIGDLSRSRFKREMEVLMRLSHPSIIKVFDAGIADGRLYYVMELLRARDLHWHQKRRGKLPVDVVVGLLDQQLDALEYLHAKGIVHRDIKPSNILLEESGRSVLMDFGVVRTAGGTLLTAEGHAVGTPRYFSPEMLQKGVSDALSDQWSLGVVAYEILTGAMPFEGDTLPQVAYSIMKTDPVPLSVRRPELPGFLEPIVHRMLAKDPMGRWPGCGEARAALQAALAEWQEAPDTLLESSLVPLPPAPPASRPTAKRPVAPQQQDLVTGESILSEFSKTVSPPVKVAVPLAVVLVMLMLVPLIRWLWPAPRRDVTPVVGGAPTRQNITVKRIAPDRLSIEFPTRTESRWAVDRGKGPEALEATDRLQHRLEIATSPWEPEPQLALVSGPYRVDVDPPPSLKELVSRLATATKGEPFSTKTLNVDVWMRIRGIVLKVAPRMTSKVFREGMKRAPAAHEVLKGHAAVMKHHRKLDETLSELGPFVPMVLASEETPKAARVELMRALFQLDRFDGLASWLGVPPVFGVQSLMAPTVVITAAAGPELPATQLFRMDLKIGPDNRGMVLVQPNEVPAGMDNPLLSARDTALLMRSRTEGRSGGPRATFEAPEIPSPPVRRLHFLVDNMDPQNYLRVRPAGIEMDLPIRPPDGWAPPSDRYWLTVTLRGELARPTGTWALSHGRAFDEISKLYITVDKVKSEALTGQ